MEPTESELRKFYYDDRLPASEIGRMFGLSYHSIYARMDRYGMPRRPAGRGVEHRGKTAPTCDELKKLYLEDALTTRQIGEMYGVSKTSVLRWLKRFDIQKRTPSAGLENRGVTAPTKAELEHMVWTQHLSYPAIAGKYGVDSSAIRHWLIRHDIPRPKVWDTRRKGRHPEPFSIIDVSVRYGSGESVRSIAASYGVSDRPLRDWMDQQGIERRPDGWKQKRYACSDGHQARSVYEQRVDNWLYRHGIEHEVEPQYPWDKRYRADFKVGDSYIEVWGVTGSESYNRRKQHKIDMCAKWGLPLIHINHWQFAEGRRFWSKLAPLKSQDVSPLPVPWRR